MHRGIKWKQLAFSLVIAVSIGMISIFMTQNHMFIYSQIHKPPFAPSKEMFAWIWCILSILMGISAYLIYNTEDYMKNSALYMYATQLLTAICWPILFFNFHQFFLSFLILILLWMMVMIMIAAFSSIHKVAAILQLPYIIWLSFVLYLNIGICILNF